MKPNDQLSSIRDAFSETPRDTLFFGRFAAESRVRAQARRSAAPFGLSPQTQRQAQGSRLFEEHSK